MRGTIFPHFRGGLGQVDAMRAQAAKGEPLEMVDGLGRAWGRYVITEVRECSRVFFSNGAPRAIEFDLTIASFGDDDSSSATGAGTGAAAPAAPQLPVADLSSYIDKATSADIGSIAGKSVVSIPGVRSLVGMTSAGVSTVADAIRLGTGAIGTVQSEIEGVQRAARAVTGALAAITSPASVAEFGRLGLDIDLTIRQARDAGEMPLGAVLDGIGALGDGAVIGRVIADADQRAALGALIGGRAGG